MEALLVAASAEVDQDIRTVAETILGEVRKKLAEEQGSDLALDAVPRYRIQEELHIQPNIRQLESDDPRARLGAAEMLGSFHDPRAVEPLVKAMFWNRGRTHRAHDDTLPQAAATALGRIGDPQAVEPLISMMEERLDGYWAAADALAMIGDRRAVGPLLRIFADLSRRSEVGAEGVSVVDALGNLRDPRAVEPLITIGLKHRNSSLRQASARALGKLGDQQALSSLLSALNDTQDGVHSIEVRAAVAGALGELGDRRAVDSLMAKVLDKKEHYRVRRKAADALAALHDPRVIEPMKTILRKQRDHPELGPAAVQILGAMRVQGTFEFLSDLLQDSNSMLREAAAKAMPAMRDARSIEPLVRAAAKDTDSFVRRAAIDSLIALAHSQPS